MRNDFTAGSNTSNIGNPYFFTARRFDTLTGLYYYRARYYSPKIGRFLQTDPIGHAAGLNLYTYCGNNPLNWIDPLGLCKDDSREGKHHDLRQTQRILEWARSLGSCGRPPWHEGLHFMAPWAGGYDYKYTWDGKLSKDRFTILEKGKEVTLSASGFGNYIAGYLAQWHRGTVRHVYWAGDIEAGGKDDRGSKRDIARGVRDAKAEHRRQNEEFKRRHGHKSWMVQMLIRLGPI